MQADARLAATVSMLLLIGGCTGATQSGPRAGPSETAAVEAGSAEQYLELTSALENINRVINLGNEGHVAIQRIFDTPDPFSEESLGNIQAAREVWQRIDAALGSFTSEAKRQLTNLVAGIRVLKVAVDAWYDFFDATESAIAIGGGPDTVDELISLQEYANGETAAGMGFMELAAEEAVEKICAIDPDAPACFLNSPPPT